MTCLGAMCGQEGNERQSYSGVVTNPGNRRRISEFGNELGNRRKNQEDEELASWHHKSRLMTATNEYDLIDAVPKTCRRPHALALRSSGTRGAVLLSLLAPAAHSLYRQPHALRALDTQRTNAESSSPHCQHQAPRYPYRLSYKHVPIPRSAVPKVVTLVPVSYTHLRAHETRH